MLAEPEGGKTKVQALGNVVVVKNDPPPDVGDPAIASDTPTLASVGGDAAAITTRTPPDESLLQYSVADSLAARVPFVVTFATPKFCTSRTSNEKSHVELPPVTTETCERVTRSPSIRTPLRAPSANQSIRSSRCPRMRRPQLVRPGRGRGRTYHFSDSGQVGPCGSPPVVDVCPALAGDQPDGTACTPPPDRVSTTTPQTGPSVSEQVTTTTTTTTAFV